MPLARVHDARQQRDDGELGQAEGEDTKGEADEGPEDNGFLLLAPQRLKVAAVAVFDGDEGDGNRDPDADLVPSLALLEVRDRTSPAHMARRAKWY